MPADKPSAKP